jgi:diguanylate cyclase
VGLDFKRALQLGTMCGIVVLGALIWRQSTENPFVQACVFGLIALGVAGVGLSEVRLGAGRSAAMRDDRAEPSRRPAEPRFAADVAAILRLLKAYARDNTSYSESLDRANASLPLLDEPEKIRAVVLSLIEENQKIQGRMNDLSRNLDESVAKIEKLSSNLAEANDKALRDPLTALGNRRFFDQRLAQAMAEAPASGGLCLVICDLDRFKAINDKFGHPVGDMVLKLFAEIISANVGQRDTVARLGGEEFAVVIPGQPSTGAVSTAEQIRRQLEGKKWVARASGEPLGTVTASFGVAQFRQDEEAGDLVKRADEALYRAKSEGRNRIIAA